MWSTLKLFTGLSFNRLVHALQGYGGPTILIIEDDKGSIFGGYSTTEWKESNSFYGSDASFLFQLQPTFAMYRSRLSNNKPNYMYLNQSGFELPHGLGMGGTVDGFRLFLPESFDSGICRSQCMTFEEGFLTSTDTIDGSNEFVISAVEVWGCGGESSVADALNAQEKHRELKATYIAKARKVDKAQFWGNEFDREHFFQKTGGSSDSSHRLGSA